MTPLRSPGAGWVGFPHLSQLFYLALTLAGKKHLCPLLFCCDQSSRVYLGLCLEGVTHHEREGVAAEPEAAGHIVSTVRSRER